MAGKVTISTISVTPPRTDLTFTCRQMVEGMTAHLNWKVERVLPDSPDLIVLPEHCDAPANLGEREREYYEARGDIILDNFRETARRNKTYIAYSAKRKDEKGDWRNSTVIIDRNGGVAGVDNKNHLVIKENTEDGVVYGNETPLIRCDFGTVACIICFDLNFTVLLDRYAKLHPDLLVFSSAYHGGLMQPYWAYACRAHFVGALRGLPGTIISPMGDTIASTTNYCDFVTASVNLDCCVVHIDGHARSFIEMKKKYGKGVTIYDPGYVGCVLITNHMEGVTVRDIIKEFGMELMDDYFARSLEHRRENVR